MILAGRFSPDLDGTHSGSISGLCMASGRMSRQRPKCKPLPRNEGRRIGTTSEGLSGNISENHDTGR